MQVLKGKDTGKIGTIIDIIRERNWVIIEGLNCVSSWTFESIRRQNAGFYPGLLECWQLFSWVCNNGCSISCDAGCPGHQIGWGGTVPFQRCQIFSQIKTKNTLDLCLPTELW